MTKAPRRGARLFLAAAHERGGSPTQIKALHAASKEEESGSSHRVYCPPVALRFVI